MAEDAAAKELSSDPGELVRVYDEYVQALEAQLIFLLSA
jgi:hypothetical protein